MSDTSISMDAGQCVCWNFASSGMIRIDCQCGVRYPVNPVNHIFECPSCHRVQSACTAAEQR